jgi:hypothetical protein
MPLKTILWSAGFFERLADVGPETTSGVDELLATIRAARASKRPREL